MESSFGMSKKLSVWSTEVWAGIGMTIMGLLALLLGRHDLLSQALAPFGIGLILSDLLTRLGKTARESVKVFIRRDDN
jgi:hypothetical protein